VTVTEPALAGVPFASRNFAAPVADRVTVRVPATAVPVTVSVTVLEMFDVGSMSVASGVSGVVRGAATGATLSVR